MRRMSRGFTIIELLVVVSVIGILSTISLIGFNRYQTDTRDSQRQSQATLISEALEKYYDANGEYPGCPAITAAASSITSTTLPGLDPKVLVTPKDPTVETNSIKCQDMTDPNGPDVFAYVGDGSSVCSTGNSCLSFTLKYIQESTNTIASINSRRQASLLTSGSVKDLTATTYSFSAVNLAWTAIGGATSYNVQYSTNGATWTAFTSANTTSTQVTGLTLGTTYYFQVQPASATIAGAWSNTASATTFTLDTPTGTASTDATLPASKLDFTWNAITNATSYTVQYVTGSSCSFTSPTTITSATSPTYISGLGAGVTLCFRVQALAAGYTSGWSAPSYATTQVPAPSCTASTVVSNTSITVSWSTVAVATHYNMQISTNSAFSPGGYTWDLTGTSQNASGLNNATTYYFRVKALLGSSNSSTWATCPSATTGIDGPTSVGWSADAYGVRNTANVAWMPGDYPGAGTYWTNGMYIYGTCQPGATIVTRLYQYYAYSNNTVQNTSHLMDWTWGNQDRYVVGGRSTWYVWWQGWVACQVGGTRVGDTYLGNAGPY